MLSHNESKKQALPSWLHFLSVPTTTATAAAAAAATATRTENHKSESFRGKKDVSTLGLCKKTKSKIVFTQNSYVFPLINRRLNSIYKPLSLSVCVVYHRQNRGARGGGKLRGKKRGGVRGDRSKQVLSVTGFGGSKKNPFPSTLAGRSFLLLAQKRAASRG